MRVQIRWALSFATILLLGILVGCGGGGGGASSSGDGGGTSYPAKILSWAAPEAYTDDTSLNPMTDLDRYEIYVNESGSFAESDTPSAVVSAVDTQTHTLTSSFNLANLGPSLFPGVVYRVSMRAVAITGLKSGFSPSASFSF